MNALSIERHSFDLAKNRLKEFSEKTEAELAIDRVRTDGGFLGLGDHKVTGYELNRRLETIQQHFIAVNTTNNNVIKEFREVYNALDALDKDYISSIVANVKAIEKTSNDVRVQQGVLKQHNEKLAKQQDKLDAHQVEIEKSIATISKIVTTLKSFKEKLEKFKHLADIDKIWSDCQKWHSMSSSLSASISKALETGEKNAKTVTDLKHAFEYTDDQIAQLSNSIKQQADCLNSIVLYLDSLEAIAHLKDVDTIWSDMEEAKSSLENLFDELNGVRQVSIRQQQEIGALQSFVETVSMYDHLKDVDPMWSDLEDAKSSLKRLFNELNIVQQVTTRQHQEIEVLRNFVETTSSYHHLQDVDTIWDKVESNEQKLSRLSEQIQITDKAVKQNQTAIEVLAKHKEELSSIVHLNDLDNLWEQTEKHVSQITALQTQGEESIKLIQQNKESVDQTLSTAKKKADTMVQQLNKKIQYAYWLAGGATVLALIELFVIFTGL